MPRLRLSLTIPGTASLGAYESGALAALVVAAKELGEDVLVIDSIAPASAGSTTALLAARALLEGIDPVALLTSGWAEHRSPEAAVGPPDSTLQPEALAAMATILFGPNRMPSGPAHRRQKEPIWLSLALKISSGPTCDAPDRIRDNEISVDWYIVTLTATTTPQEYFAYADAGIAAGSHAVGSAANPQDQPGEERQCEGTGLLGLPEDGPFWYTDGGTVDNQPLNRAIDLAENVASDDERLYVVVTPDPAFPTRSLSDTWSDDTLVRPVARAGTHDICGAQPSIYEALEQLEETGSQVAQIGSALADALEAVQRRQANVESAARRILAEREADHSDDYASLLESVVQSSSGVGARRPVPVEVISPSIDPSVTEPPSQQLVGAFFNHFGGHFDIALRRSDFCLGYRNMGYWLEHRLGGYLPHLNLSAAREVVERRYNQTGWNGGGQANARFSAPSFRGEQLGTLAFPTGRAAEHDLIVRKP